MKSNKLRPKLFRKRCCSSLKNISCILCCKINKQIKESKANDIKIYLHPVLLLLLYCFISKGIIIHCKKINFRGNEIFSVKNPLEKQSSNGAVGNSSGLVLEHRPNCLQGLLSS